MDSISAPCHTQIVTPGTTDTSHHRLRIVATVCWKLFERCTKVAPSDLGRNYGKFKVWCGNLGVRQGGHASLDWRLKDDDVMENEVFSMLTDLEDDLQQVLELLSGTRPPYEQEEPGSETSSLDGSLLPGELEVRLDAINATMTALYQMSFLVRNQGTRRLASAKAQNYQPRDPDEAALLESFVSFDRQHIDDLFRDLRRPRSDEGQPMASRSDHRSDGASQDRALKARCLIASTARRRQLAYWKMHSSKLKSIAAMPDVTDPDANATIYSGTEASGVFKRIERDFDVVEVQSLTSVASTVRDIDGYETEFPGPPERSSDNDPFECPYCFVLCQPEEAGRRRWKKHILEDLRPYICTYPDCQDGTQLYGSRREWTAHEDDAHRSSTTSDIDASNKRMNTDNRTQCPICLLDVADLPSRAILTKHLASHLERFSLDCLPLDTSSWGDQNIHDNGSESSDPDQDLYPEPHKQTFSDEQEVGGVSSEDETTGDSRVEEIQWPDEYVRGRGDQYPDLPGEHLRMSKWTAEGEELRTSELADAGTEEYDLLQLERIRSQRKRVEEKSKHWRELPSAEWNHKSYNSGSGDNSRDSIDAERKRTITDHERREQELKEQEGRAAAELLRSRQERMENESDDKRAEQDKMNDAMRKRLAEADFTQSQIDAIMSSDGGRKQQPAPKMPKKAPPPASNPTSLRAPIYAKIHTEHMAIEILKWYDIPWEYDQSDPSYIIILRELDEHETNILFDSTRKFREGRFVLNESGNMIPKDAEHRARQKRTDIRRGGHGREGSEG